MNRNFFPDSGSAILATSLVQSIAENAAHLSEIDGAIGDGDHGINMRKGFDRFATLASEKNIKAASEALILLGSTLMSEIGGSMGPLYGSMFRAMGKAIRGKEIDSEVFLEMLCAGKDAVMNIGDAKPGDKTMLDALVPAFEAFSDAVKKGLPFELALTVMGEAASAGAKATINMVAKIGRASRLGERSRGVQDAGATSCAIILNQIASTAKKLLNTA